MSHKIIICMKVTFVHIYAVFAKVLLFSLFLTMYICISISFYTLSSDVMYAMYSY